VKLIAFLVGALGPWFWGAVACLLIASHAGVALWVQAQVNERWELREAQHKAATQRVIAMEQAKQRDIEARWQDAADLSRKELDDARKTIADQAARLGRLQLDAGQLRNQLAAYAAGGAGQDSLAACQTRASTLAAYASDLGSSAAEVAAVAVVAAKERDEYAAEVVACVSAWPKAGRVTGPSDEN
jgi:hypothetical protein